VALLAMQQLLLRWSLSPLSRVRQELRRVQRGEASALSSDYPRELSGLTRGLNTIIQSERETLERQRHTLADLAHSLKTPLAVIRARFESEADGAPPPVCHDVLEQVRRMDGIIAYQLSRAAAKGRQTFAAPVPVAAHAEALVQGLEKVHAVRRILCEFDIDPEARFFGAEGDLLELLGNLTENAFKWARSRVLLSVHRLLDATALREGLEIVVEDDGPGIPPERVERLLQRGVRGDERVQGHGIGLAIVVDLVHAYRAEMGVDRSAALGGARFSLRFPPIR
jgi:two-component system sensor histidine kinase PhoQ